MCGKDGKDGTDIAISWNLSQYDVCMVTPSTVSLILARLSYMYCIHYLQVGQYDIASIL